MKFISVAPLFLLSWITIFAQPITIHPEKRFLSNPDGTPFFWLGDTAWELFHRLDRAEAARYLQTRKAQGFNIIQAVALYELQSFEAPNAYGDFPLIDENIDQINRTPGNNPDNSLAYDYWDHLKYILELAQKNDLIIGLLPAWGEYVTPRKRTRTISTIKQGYEYGYFIGDWLKEYNDHIVWILGGDRLPDEKPKGVDIWRAMAEGITDAINGKKLQNGESDYTKTFMTYHCYASSSKWFAEDDWIDMHTWGSYHERKNNERAFYVSWMEWDRGNHKPFINSEPAYEKIPINYDWADISNGKFDAIDVRQIAYWSVFSGCAGHTYGAHEVWIMHKFSNPNLPLTTHNDVEWETALTYEGAKQMIHLKDLMLSFDFYSRQPNREIIAVNPNDPAGRLIATTGKDYALVYTATGKRIVIDQSKLLFQSNRAKWFNPRTGDQILATIMKDGDYFSFDPPGAKVRGNDWVLILQP